MSPGGVYVCEDVHGAENRFAAFSFGIVNALNDNARTTIDLDDPEKRIVSKTDGPRAAIKAICFYPLLPLKWKTPPSRSLSLPNTEPNGSRF